jgi:1,4-alpha-glucan branching enzyme
MFTHPGSKLLFMGGEFGQTSEWSIERGLEWWLMQFEHHKGMHAWIRTLNHFYKGTKALHERQFSPDGFEWINHGDHQTSVLSYLRKGKDAENPVAVICNFTPMVRKDYKVGLPFGGSWKEVINSDSRDFGGSGHHFNEKLKATEENYDGKPFAVSLNLPALAVIVLERISPGSKKASAPKKKAAEKPAPKAAKTEKAPAKVARKKATL